jgi:DNA helicase-2/ATP-dependent DNA helicase PcrA
MKLSKYQKNILKHINEMKEKDALLCQAVAGSGKSTTLKLIAQELTKQGFNIKDIKLIVFGKENSKDLIAKLGEEWGYSVSTIHSTGFSLIAGYLQVNKLKVLQNKYRNICKDKRYIRVNSLEGRLTKEKVITKETDFFRLIDLARLTNIEINPETIEDLCDHYLLDGIADYKATAKYLQEVLSSGINKASQDYFIDFTDMIWLPTIWKLTRKYEWVLIDECQDLNACQLWISQNLGKRLIYVGDSSQAIYGFSGADCDSVDKILKATKAKELPLSVCYRCPQSHIDLVKILFPSIPIESSFGVKKGNLHSIDCFQLQSLVSNGDLILSRKTSPLISLCISLIAKSVPAKVKGREIGKQLIDELEEIEKLPYFRFSHFRECCYTYLVKKTEELVKKKKYYLADLLEDKINALIVIQENNNKKTVEECKNHIEEIFSDEDAPVTLSTIHRAKGLERERVFIIEPQDLPLSYYNQPKWQKKQEDNLLYVALTRAKNTLFIVGNPKWLNYALKTNPLICSTLET